VFLQVYPSPPRDELELSLSILLELWFILKELLDTLEDRHGLSVEKYHKNVV
jgi:hypothetical protein